MKSTLFEVYKACSPIVADRWHSLGMLKRFRVQLFFGLNQNRDLCADTVLSLSSFVRCGSGLPVKNCFELLSIGLVS